MSYTVSSGGLPPRYSRPYDTDWHQTPKWNWRYWVGQRWRRWKSVSMADGWPGAGWRYRTERQHARAILHERFGGAKHDAGWENTQFGEYVRDYGPTGQRKT